MLVNSGNICMLSDEHLNLEFFFSAPAQFFHQNLNFPHFFFHQKYLGHLNLILLSLFLLAVSLLFTKPHHTVLLLLLPSLLPRYQRKPFPPFLAAVGRDGPGVFRVGGESLDGDSGLLFQCGGPGFEYSQQRVGSRRRRRWRSRGRCGGGGKGSR